MKIVNILQALPATVYRNLEEIPGVELQQVLDLIENIALCTGIQQGRVRN